MTSTAGTEEHPEVSEISAFTEGILPPDRSADLREHLALCVLCADVRDSLAEIRDLLGTLPGPVRMPEDVAGRIDAALAAEALIAAIAPSGPGEPVDGLGEPGGDEPLGVASTEAPEAVGAHVSRETSPPVGRPHGHSRAATGPGRAARRSRRRSTLLATACAAGVLGLGGFLVHALGTHDQGTAAAASGSHQKSVARFSGVRVPTKVHQLLASGASHASPSAGARAGKNSPFIATVPTVPPCVLKATRRTSPPIAASKGTYKGRSSYLVVLPHRSDTHRVDAYVVDSACASPSSASKPPSSAPNSSSSSSGALKTGKVLLQQTLVR